MSEQEPSNSKKPKGAIVAIAAAVVVGAAGWFAWSQIAGGPSVGEKIELEPVTAVRANSRNMAENAANALRNLGRGRRATSQPATAPAR